MTSHSSILISLSNISDHTNELPDSIDWRQRGVITPVKDQGFSLDSIPLSPPLLFRFHFWMRWKWWGLTQPLGQCGSCWTFGTAEVIESYYALATGQLATLSEQQILDCVPNTDQCGGTGGCGGGTPELAFEKLIEIGMVEQLKQKRKQTKQN